jgi:hypothetical protein
VDAVLVHARAGAFDATAASRPVRLALAAAARADAVGLDLALRVPIRRMLKRAIRRTREAGKNRRTGGGDGID